MTQDFAKIKPKQLLERTTFKLPPTWSLLLTGGLILITSAKALDQGPDNLPSNNPLEFDFYTELPTNSVPVPTDDYALLQTDQSGLLLDPVMLQSGVFSQLSSAEQEMNKQMELGFKAFVKTGEFPSGRKFYLILTGPYSSIEELKNSRQLLKSYNINSIITYVGIPTEKPSYER